MKGKSILAIKYFVVFAMIVAFASCGKLSDDTDRPSSPIPGPSIPIVPVVGELSGTITCASNTSFTIEDVDLHLSDGTNQYPTVADNNGQYSIKDIVVGEYTFTATERNHIPYMITLSVAEGKNEHNFSMVCTH